MKKIMGICLFLFSQYILAQTNIKLLLPTPKEYVANQGKTYITGRFYISLKGSFNQRIQDGCDRFLQRLKDRTGICIQQFKVEKDSFDDYSLMTMDIERPALLALAEDESYKLQITSNKISISAVTDLGGLHGLETLLQLIESDDKGYFFPSCTIRDNPRFPWRGLLIDVSRHFFPVEWLKRNLDAMAAVKLNVLHLHLSDDQGFRMECKAYPKLQQLASDGKYYTRDEMCGIIQYASDRGIRIVPEFDLPGHVSALLAAYPELGSGKGPYAIETRWGIFDPTLNPADQHVYSFLEIFYEEMSALFPDAYFHIGGDEVNGKEWDSNPLIIKFKKDSGLLDNKQLQNYFTRRLIPVIFRCGKKVMGWDEIMNPGLPKDAIIQCWRGKQAMIESVRNGFKVVLSSGYYLDLYPTATDLYLNEPLPESISLTQEQKNRVLGGEAALWSEYVTSENANSRIWPSTAAMAERLWSQTGIGDIDLLYNKLQFISLQLEDLGITNEENYEMMLRKISAQMDITALRTLTDVLVPLKGYERKPMQGYSFSSYTPSSCIVDAVLPESYPARFFNRKVEQFLIERRKEEGEAIRQQMLIWEKNDAALRKSISNSPVLAEVSDLSSALSEMASIGMEALSSLEKGSVQSSIWKNIMLNRLNELPVSDGQTRIMISESIRQLIDATSK